MTKRKTIGNNPFDAIISQTSHQNQTDTSTASQPTKTQSVTTNPKPPEPEKPEPKERITVGVPIDLAERLRNAVFWTPGLTLAAIAEEALQRHIALLEKRNGKPFPKRTGKIKTGKPIG